MTQKFLDLFNRHTFVNGPGSQSPSEFVRVYATDIDFGAHAPQHRFHAADLQTVIRFIKALHVLKEVGISLHEPQNTFRYHDQNIICH